MEFIVLAIDFAACWLFFDSCFPLAAAICAAMLGVLLWWYGFIGKRDPAKLDAMYKKMKYSHYK